MNKKDLIALFNKVLSPLGYKRKGNNWIKSNNELYKVINLQKSYYSNLFYINYGYIIKELNLTTMMHIENRLAACDSEKQKDITNLLDLDSEISESERSIKLKELINETVLRMKKVNNINDLRDELKNRQHLNDVPIIVKDYYGLE